jgi:N-methylhydantoinase B
VINTPGGGGYGNPCERAREAVLRDLAEGKVTARGVRDSDEYTHVIVAREV